MASSSSNKNLVPVSETDYLDEDKPIRNQNYVCLSFISPEDVILQKEVVFFSKYISSFSKEIDTLLNSLKERYPNDASSIDVLKENYAYVFKQEDLQDQFKFFKCVNSDRLEKEYLEENNFQTSIRGIKVRGCFETLKEAQIRAEVLKKSGDKFDIFVAAVGCWCPWSPNPDELENQEYAETHLNSMMKKYKENQINKDAFYNERKDEKMAKAKSEAEKKLKINASNLIEGEEVPAKTGSDIFEEVSVNVPTNTQENEKTEKIE
jgi:hypothetical protein